MGWWVVASRHGQNHSDRSTADSRPGQADGHGQGGHGDQRNDEGGGNTGFRATGRSRPFPNSAGRYISEMSLDLGLPGAANPFQQKIR
jgi:hypothetical protein